MPASERLTPDEISALAEAFPGPVAASQLLRAAGFPSARIPSWHTTSPAEFWGEVNRLLAAGILPDGHARLMALAHEAFPVNPTFTAAAWANETAAVVRQSAPEKAAGKFSDGTNHDNASPERWDYYISYVSADKDWAEWIAWELAETGYSVLFGEWDPAGTQKVARRTAGIQQSVWMIAVVSDEYQNDAYEAIIYQSAIKNDPQGLLNKLIPVRVRQCELAGDLEPLRPIDLFGLDETTARLTFHEQIEYVRRRSARPKTAPKFPGQLDAGGLTEAPDFPGNQASRGPAEPHGQGGSADSTSSRPSPSPTPPLLPHDEPPPQPIPPPLRVLAPQPALSEPSGRASTPPSRGVRPTRIARPDDGVPLSIPSRMKLLADLQTGRSRHPPGVLFVSFSPDGRTLAVVDDTPAMRTWRVADPKPSESGVPHRLARRPISGISFSSDGRLAALACGPDGISLWRVAKSQFTAVPAPSGHEELDDVDSVAFSERADVFVSSGPSGVALWDTPSTDHEGSVFATPTVLGRGGRGDKVAIDAYGQRVARAVTAKGTRHPALLWDVTDRGQPNAMSPAMESEPVTVLAFAGTDGMLVVATANTNGAAVHLWETSHDDQPNRRLAIIRQGVRPGPLAVRSDGGVVACGRLDMMWDLTDRERPRPVELRHDGGPSASVLSALAFSRDGRLLAAGTPTGDLTLWRVS